jgi:hypothetical protein
MSLQTFLPSASSFLVTRSPHSHDFIDADSVLRPLKNARILLDNLFFDKESTTVFLIGAFYAPLVPHLKQFGFKAKEYDGLAQLPLESKYVVLCSTSHDMFILKIRDRKTTDDQEMEGLIYHNSLYHLLHAPSCLGAFYRVGLNFACDNAIKCGKLVSLPDTQMVMPVYESAFARVMYYNVQPSSPADFTPYDPTLINDHITTHSISYRCVTNRRSGNVEELMYERAVSNTGSIPYFTSQQDYRSLMNVTLDKMSPRPEIQFGFDAATKDHTMTIGEDTFGPVHAVNKKAAHQQLSKAFLEKVVPGYSSHIQENHIAPA